MVIENKYNLNKIKLKTQKQLSVCKRILWKNKQKQGADAYGVRALFEDKKGEKINGNRKSTYSNKGE